MSPPRTHVSDNDVGHRLSFPDPPPVDRADFAGDPIQLQPKPDNTTRILFGNLQASRMDAPWSKFQSSLRDLVALNSDLVGLSEINVDTQRPAVLQRLRSDLGKQVEHAHMVAGSSPVASSGIRKPGGTMSMALGNIVGRVSSTFVDPLGRWTAHHLKGKANRIITIVSVYRACPNTRSPLTVWNQQRAALAALRRSAETPSQAFDKDLRRFLRDCASKHHLLIVGGDFNTDFGKDGILQDLCSDAALDLLDPIGLRHPQALHVPTHSRSTSRRIDHVLVSSPLLECVTRCAYLPFDQYIESDHRFMYLDLDTSLTFGDPAKLAPVIQRDINAKDPILVTKYLEALKTYLDHQNFWPRLKILQTLEAPDHHLAERLDKVLLDAKLHSEKQCRVDRRYWWSPPLAKAEETVRYYHCALETLRRGDPAPARSAHRQTLINIAPTVPSDIPEARRLLAAARSHRDDVRRHSRSYRDEHLRTLAAAADRDQNPALAKVYSDMLRQETDNRHWKRISTLKDTNRSSMVSVQVPVDPLADPKRAVLWKLVDDPPEVEATLERRNTKHFSQAHGTPFTVPPLSTDFDWAASSDSADLVLQGDYDTKSLPSIQQEFLSRCRLTIPSPESKDPPLITTADWTRRVRRWKERTTTSPSGLHLGHARALISPFSIKVHSHRGQDLVTFQESMVKAHVSLLNYATKFKYSYDRWKTIVNVMIQKEANNNRIHRLRVIHLYEYDLSIYLAVHWKRLMHESEARGAINDGQYGGRKHRNPQSLILFEELKNEICQFSRKSLVNFDNDAASCYDRILPSVASLLGRTKGLHKNVIFVHATTLKEARYKLKTDLGVSESFAQHCDLQPWFGTGQGSTNSPTIWTLVSSSLFDVHNAKAQGVEFCSPDRQFRIRITIVGFVDDSNCNTNLFMLNDQSDLQELVRRATHDAQLWADLLWLSGGLLELPKCSYHILHFDFNSNGIPYLSESVDQPIHLRSSAGAPVRVPQLPVTRAHKTLGHLKAPFDNGKSQLDAITRWCRHILAKIRRFPLNPRDSLIFYRQVVTPKFTYVLPQCYLSQHSLHRASSGLQQACTRASGFSGSMDLSIRYGPPSMGGAGFVQFSTHQGCGQLLNVLRYLRSDTMLRRIWLCALSWAQLSAGVHFPILERPKVPLPWLEGAYIKSIRTFLASIDGHLSLSEIKVPCNHRQGDLHIMSFARQHLTFNDTEWKILNCSRLYYQAVTLSDIVTPAGNQVHPSYFNFKSALGQPNTKWLHVNQPKHPRQGKWYVWHRVLRRINRLLKTRPLGPWIVPPSDQRMEWPLYYDFRQRALWYRTPNSDDWRLYVRVKAHHHERSVTTTHTVPDSCCPVDIPADTPRDPKFIRFHTIPPPPPYIGSGSQQPRSLIHRLINLPTHFAPLFSGFQWETAPLEFFRTLQSSSEDSPSLTLVSDGSAPTSGMSFGWVCADHNGVRLATCYGPAFGLPSSHRAEGCGLLSGVVFIYYCVLHFHLKPSWIIRFLCDNEALILSVKRYRSGLWRVGETLVTDWDLIAPIIHFSNLLPSASFNHVTGHLMEKRGLRFDELSLDEQLNYQADQLAEDYRRDPDLTIRESGLPFPGNPVNLCIRGSVVSTRHKEQIHLAASAPALLHHMCAYFGWDDWTYQSIDWASHRAFLRTQHHRPIQIVKLVHDQLATSLHRQQATSGAALSSCPRCGHTTEDFQHLIRCPHAADWVISTIRSVASACRAVSSNHDAVLELFTDCLSSWCDGDDAPLRHVTLGRARPLPQPLIRAVQDQTRIGWDQVFRGRLASGWRTALASCLSEPSSIGLQDSHLWITTACSTLTDRFFLLWETRNSVHHSKQLSHENNVFKSRLRRTIISLHRQFPDTRSADRDSIDFITQDPTDIISIDRYIDTHRRDELFHWIQLNRPLIMESIRLGKVRDSNQPEISTFLVMTGRFSISSSLRRRRTRRRNRQNPSTDPDVPRDTSREHPSASKRSRSRTQTNLMTNYVPYEIIQTNPDVSQRRDQPDTDDADDPPSRSLRQSSIKKFTTRRL